MEKSATLNLRVNPTLKKEAEAILNKLGVPMSVAVDMLLNQIVLTKSIPFAVALPNAPADIDGSAMSADQIHAKLQAGYDSYLAGDVRDAAAEFEQFKKHSKNKGHLR